MARRSQIDCYVRSVTGAVATLGRLGGLPAGAAQRALTGLARLPDVLPDGEPIALRGVATVDCATDAGFRVRRARRDQDARAPERRPCRARDSRARCARSTMTASRSPNAGRDASPSTSASAAALVERRPADGNRPATSGRAVLRRRPEHRSCCNGGVARLTSHAHGPEVHRDAGGRSRASRRHPPRPRAPESRRSRSSRLIRATRQRRAVTRNVSWSSIPSRSTASICSRTAS